MKGSSYDNDNMDTMVIGDTIKHSNKRNRASSLTASFTGDASEVAGGVTFPQSPASATTAATASSSTINPKSTSLSASQHATADTVDAQQRLQDRKVCYIRAVMLATLLAATAVVSGFAWWFVAKGETNIFELQYGDSVSKVAEAFQHRIDTKRDTAMTFSAVITSRYGNAAQARKGLGPAWPNVTVPDFQEQTAGSLAIADGRALSFNPIITQDVNRLAWEAHATESAWMLGDDRLVTPDPYTEFPDNRTVAFGIYSRDSDRNVVYDPGHAPESELYKDVMVPVWQIAPIKTNEKAVMFNLHSEGNRREALDHMMEHRVPTLTAILQLVQDAETRPSSILFYPVFDTFSSSDGDDDKDPSNKVVGSISIVFSWDNLLDKILPDYIKGMICVLRSSTGQEFSYSISGHKVTLLGEGDMHDVEYEQYGQHVKAHLISETSTSVPLEEEVVGDHHDDDNGESNSNNRSHFLDLTTYELHMYPSSEFKAQYVTNRASIYAAGAVLIFLFTACLFLLYDYLVENRQQKTARLARQTGNIVDSMFPPAFRERLYSIHNNNNNNGNGDDSVGRRRSSTSSGRRSSVRSARSNLASSLTSGARSNLTSSLNSGLKSGVVGGGAGGDAPIKASSTMSSPAAEDETKDCKATTSNTRVLGNGRVSLSLPRQMSVRRSVSTMGGGKIVLRKQIDMFMKSNRVSSTPSGDQDQSNPLVPLFGGVNDEPIADLYHDTSIMFSDIVGFTKWSSERSPNEVFHLLEQIFWEFDDIAARHNVFKLGTIGDCYIAVTGIPDPIEDHATVLTQFAFEARDKVREVCSRLEGEGLDTAKLDMRFGIHSGATTAGILRGTKSRFELFGDTINTASRMESTGLGGKIQVSEETAELIRRDGKPRWLIKRDSMITAKGKGQLQTYWVEPQHRRVSFSEKIAKFFLEDSFRSSRESGQDLYRESSGSTSSDLHLEEKVEIEDSNSQLLCQWDEEEKIEEVEEMNLDQVKGLTEVMDCASSKV